MSPRTRLRLIHWNEAEAEERAAELRALGCEVLPRLSEGTPGLRELRADPGDAVVIDLGRLPAHGRDMALVVREQKATRRVPLVFVDGKPEKVDKVRRLLPDAVYTTWDRIGKDLAAAVAHPPESPVVPRTRLDGYSGTPLPRKLGIKAGSTVALVNAPEDFEQTLGRLPDDVTLRRRARGRVDLTLWFVTSRRELDRRIERLADFGAAGLWIVWPKKASGVATDVTQNIVRRAGLDHGLVDYKICAVDATWSGLKFSVRR